MRNIINNTLKTIIFIMIGIIFFFAMEFSLSSYQSKSIDYALRVATEDATSTLINGKNYSLKNLRVDGNREDDNYFAVNRKETLNRFLESFNLNALKIYSSSIVSVMGILDYDGIQIYFPSEGWQVKEYYYYDIDNKKYQFTLGDAVVIKDLISKTRVQKNINDISQINSDMSNEELRDYVVMELATQMLGLPKNHFDVVAVNGKNKYNTKGNVANSPCFFAFVDNVNIGLTGKKYSSVKFGGSELHLTKTGTGD